MNAFVLIVVALFSNGAVSLSSSQSFDSYEACLRAAHTSTPMSPSPVLMDRFCMDKNLADQRVEVR